MPQLEHTSLTSDSSLLHGNFIGCIISEGCFSFQNETANQQSYYFEGLVVPSLGLNNEVGCTNWCVTPHGPPYQMTCPFMYWMCSHVTVITNSRAAHVIVELVDTQGVWVSFSAEILGLWKWEGKMARGVLISLWRMRCSLVCYHEGGNDSHAHVHRVPSPTNVALKHAYPTPCDPWSLRWLASVLDGRGIIPFIDPNVVVIRRVLNSVATSRRAGQVWQWYDSSNCEKSNVIWYIISEFWKSMRKVTWTVQRD